MNAFQLIQWKHAIRLEAMGMTNSRGSVNAHAARELGLAEGGKRPNRVTVLAEIDRRLDLIKSGEVADTGPAILS